MRKIFVVLLLMLSVAHAADPYRTLNSSDNFVALQQAEQALNVVDADTPSQIAAANSALMAMANLALDDDYRWNCSFWMHVCRRRIQDVTASSNSSITGA